MGAHPRVVDRQHTDVYPRITTRQRTDDNLRAVNVGRNDASLMVLAMQQMDRNPRAKDACCYKQNPVGHNKGSPIQEIFNIF